MALKRKIEATLEQWHASPKNKAFLLVGARQTGKTFVVRHFAENNFDHLVEINFLENRAAARLLSEASDTQDFIARLSLLSTTPLVPHASLIFLDEIQVAPDILTVAKFLVEDGRFPLVLSGSMLGTELKGTRSFPVGYAQIERMFPLDFEEFCWSQNVSPAIIDQIREAHRQLIPLDEGLHERLISLYRYYVAIGGMPEAVQTYLDSSYDVGAVRFVCEQIVENYRYDIAQYAEPRAPQIRAVFDAVPSQLDKENKRFRMDALKKGGMFERYAHDFDWLIDAAVVIPVYATTEPKRPLKRTAQANKFKLYSPDTGLLLAQYSSQTMLDVIANSPAINFGAVYENAVAQELVCRDPNLYYFRNNRKGEVDFIIERDDGSLLPIEVKSGKDYKLHTALNNLLSTEDFGINEACVLSMANVSQGARAGKPVHYLPLYMTFCIAEQMGGSLAGVQIAPPEF